MMKMRSSIITLAALLLGTPAFGQTTLPAAATALPEAPINPARLVAAAPVIDQIWPMGTYARIMHGVMDQMTKGMMGSMYDMRPEDFVPDDKKAKVTDGKTLGELMRESDPYFQQRTEITMRVMFDEMGKLMTEVEPDVRAGLTKSYARHFTATQLGELHSFFSTATGRTYAADSMLLMMGPDMMQSMQSFAPRMIKALPAIMAKATEATKDLPPPPKKAP